jgi:hypothetical protein
MTLGGRLKAYAADANPHVAAANTIALMLAWNQPFYPLYLYWIVGRDAWTGIPDAFSAVLFAVVPAVCRRAPLAGRVFLVAISALNVAFCSAMLGEDAGVQLLYLPCGMLAAMLFSWRERWIMAPMATLPLVLWLLTRGRLDTPPVRFSAEAYGTLFRLNAVSAGLLMVFFGWLLAGIARDTERALLARALHSPSRTAGEPE